MRGLIFYFSSDGGEIHVCINGFYFAYKASNVIGFGLNLSLVNFFKVIQRPKFHWIWNKPHIH